MNKVKRFTKDGRPTGRTTRIADALQPLVEGIQRLDASLDRTAKAIEKRRQDARDARLRAIVDEAATNLHAEAERKRRLEEEFAFERKLFGKRLPRTFAERIGLDEVT